jgi:hypothetical protein
MKRKLLILFLAVLTQIFLNVCSDRVETPIEGGSSTLVYPSKSVNGIEATITFYERISKQTGDPIKEGYFFTIKENAKVYAVVNLTNRKFHENKDLMFHIDWLDSSGNSLFKKRIDLTTDDSSSTVTSLINISADKREPGNYSMRVYLFRELIAEKKFELINQMRYTNKVVIKDLAESIKARISFCQGISKKTGKLISTGNKFTIKDKAKVLAIINLENKDTSDQELTFYADWIGPNNSSFYKKKIDVSSNSNSFSSSISISPEKRQPGKYLLRFYLFDKLITEGKFELIRVEKKEKTISTKLKAENIAARILLCQNVSKKTGKPIKPDSIFTMSDKKNVKAFIYIEKIDTSNKQQLSFVIDWVGPDGNSFYKKKIELLPDDSTTTISSSISVSPQKRQPGNYLVRVYLFKELISEKNFILQEEAKK